MSTSLQAAWPQSEVQDLASGLPVKPEDSWMGCLQGACGGDLEDLLPGLCALCQQWLSDVVFTRFRGMDAVHFDLNSWFSQPRVAFFLRVSFFAIGS